MVKRPPSSDQAARPKRSPRAAKDIDLNDVAILEVDGLLDERPRSFPREIALAFGDGRTGLAWMIAPEAMWPMSGSPPAHRGFTSIGVGMHPVMMVRELLAATQGLRVYSESQSPTARWLARFFEAASMDVTVEVRDLRKLLVPSEKEFGTVRPEDIQRADRAANTRFGVSARASQDAARHMAFARGLRELRRQRLAQEAASGASESGANEKSRGAAESRRGEH